MVEIIKELNEIASGIYQIRGKRSNIFLLADKELTLIDTGMPGDDSVIREIINKIGRKPEEINHILITHSHMDHTGSLGAIKKTSNAKVVASKLEVDYIEGKKKKWTIGREGFGGKIFKTIMFVFETFVWKYEPANVDIPCSGGEILNLFGKIEVIATPGHSPGSLSFYLIEKGIIFVGDALSSIPDLRPPLRAGCSDYEEAILSVKKISELSFDICCCSHGEPITGEADKKVRALVH